MRLESAQNIRIAADALALCLATRFYKARILGIISYPRTLEIEKSAQLLGFKAQDAVYFAACFNEAAKQFGVFDPAKNNELCKSVIAKMILPNLPSRRLLLTVQ
jgi:hypothetical protein